MDAILRSRLESGEIAFGVHFRGDLQGVFRTNGDTKAATFAAIFIDNMVINQSLILLIICAGASC